MSNSTSSTKYSPSSPQSSSLLSLPAELRNQIYTLIASSTTLTLIDPPASLLTTNNPKANLTLIPGKPCPSLLLTSHKTRSEYLPILLSTARIHIPVTDFDFEGLKTYISTTKKRQLQDDEDGGEDGDRSGDGVYKALASNPNLIIHLRFQKCGSEVYSNLQRWCTFTNSSLDSCSTCSPIPFNYTLSPNHELNSMQLQWFAGRCSVLRGRLEATTANVPGVEDEGERTSVEEIDKILSVLGEAMREVQRYVGGRSWNRGVGDAFVMFAANTRGGMRS